MGAADLAAEMEAAGLALKTRHLDRLRSLGVTLASLADMGERGWPFGVTKAEPVGGGYYQPGEGDDHIILPVCEDGALIDLCAFRSARPDDWLMRTGLGFALGLEEGLSRWTWFAPADPDAKPRPKYEVGHPPHLFSNPLQWLRGAGNGLCVLNWGAPEVRSLDVLTRLTADDHETAALLTRALMRPVRLPQIEVIGGLSHAA